MTFFKFTTADENDGPGETVGADLRAATNLDTEVAAQERCSHIKTVFSSKCPMTFQAHEAGRGRPVSSHGDAAPPQRP